MAVHFLVFLPISSRNSIQEFQIHYSKWDKHIQNVLQHCDDFQLFSESHNLVGCGDSLLLLPRPPFVYKGFATTAPQQRHFLQRAHGLKLVRPWKSPCRKSMGLVSWQCKDLFWYKPWSREIPDCLQEIYHVFAPALSDSDHRLHADQRCKSIHNSSKCEPPSSC